jgi:hypothetical protein
MQALVKKIPVLAGLVLIVLLGTSAQTSAQEDTHYTPIVMSVLAAPNPVRGSDDAFHLVYELQVTNASGVPWRIDTVEVLDTENDDRVLASFSGDDVLNQMVLLSDRSPTNTLEPGQAGLIFLHVPIATENAIPSTLAHRLTIGVPGGIPPEIARFAGLPPGEEHLIETGGMTEVSSAEAIVVGPPLEGSGWIAANGCCTSPTVHIRAVLPIDGQLHLSQRFAIDWMLLNDDNRLFVGDPSDVQSYFSYGANVLAVADAEVVAAADGFKDQVPGELPTDITLEELLGNHVVLDLGNGHFAFYAHLKPNSVTVKEGDQVRRGQVLALLGNSGNTSAPHLHFHVMDSPSAVGSKGLPYVIDAFDLLGRSASDEAFGRAIVEGKPLEVAAVDDPGRHTQQLPLDQIIVGFESSD